MEIIEMALRKYLVSLCLTLTSAFLIGCGQGPGDAPGPRPSDVEEQSPSEAAQLPKGVSATPAVAANQALDSGAVILTGYTVRKDEGLTEVILYWRDTKPVNGDYSALFHLYPTSPSALPADRKQSGFLNFDHDPLLQTSVWQPNKVYLSRHRGDIAPGTYRVLTGLYTGAGRTRRMKPVVPGTGVREKDALDLGEIKIP
jgi:hypothetical protein